MFSTNIFSNSLFRNEVFHDIVKLTVVGVSTYYAVKWIRNAMDPARKEKIEAQKQAQKLMRQIGIKDVKLTEYEMSIAAQLVDPRSVQVTWNDIAGLDDEVAELKRTMILPIQKRHLFPKSRLLQPPKGVLLYGPPGCGKTLIAKATAREAGCRFLNLQPSILADKWYGESEKRAAAVFSLAMKIQPTIVFIDEIDSFLRNRSSTDHETTAMIKAQFLSLWDGLDTDHNCQVIIMGATNRPRDIDPAILRRMPARLHIGLPALEERVKLLSLIMDYVNVDEDVNLIELAEYTEGFSGSDLRELCRDAAMLSLREYAASCSDDGLSEECEEAVAFKQHHLMKAAKNIRMFKGTANKGMDMPI